MLKASLKPNTRPGVHMDKADLISNFETQRDTYSSFSETLGALISRLLAADGIELHSVGHRCKTVNSFRGKIEKKNNYESLEEVTDLAGVRLITHYEDDVDRVARVIESEFEVDRDNSIDKRKALDPDRFGYLSLHYVVSLRADRAALREYTAFSGLKAEVQIRSILQHTWAEIEHDTGYKSDVEVPKHIRRRFSRLAGLLELADQEFIGIREALKEYSIDVAAKVETSIEPVDGEPDVFIDKVSLAKFYEVDPLVQKLDEQIVEIMGGRRGSELKHALADISRLKTLGIETLARLKEELASNENYVLERARFIARSKNGASDDDKEYRIAICVFYLLQILAAKAVDVQGTRALLREMGFSSSPMLADNLRSIVEGS